MSQTGGSGFRAGLAPPWVGNLALLPGALLVAFTLAELATRVIAPHGSPPG